jgi:predicted acylesterase/phospholipase RssA
MNMSVGVVILFVGVGLFLLVSWAVFKYLSTKNQVQESLASFRVVAKEELPALHAYCLSKFGGQISDLPTMIPWHERNPQIFEILTRKPAGSATMSDIEGYFSLLPLTEEARHAVNKGTYAGATLPPEAIATDDSATALYIGGIAANTSKGQVKAVFRLRERLRSFDSAKVIYTRPVTEHGLKWVRDAQFTRVDGKSELFLGYLCKKDVEDSETKRGRIRPRQKVAPKRTTRFFQTCYGTFQGGGCRAAAYVGAFAEAEVRGVRFVEVAGTSAGSIIAAFIAAGATPLQLREIVNRLDFSGLLAPPTPLKKSISLFLRPLLRTFASIPHPIPQLLAGALLRNGQYSLSKLQDWVEKELRQLLDLAEDKKVRFKHLHSPISIVAADLFERKVKVWNSIDDPEFEVSAAVCASCAIPFFFQPFDNQYADGGTLSSLPTFVFNRQDGKRRLSLPVLAFTLQADFEPTELERPLGLISALVNTMVDGSQDIQDTLQDNIHTISIPTGKIKATDFMEMDPDKIGILAKNGQLAMRRYLVNELDKIHMKSPSRFECSRREEVLAMLADKLVQARKGTKVTIAFEELAWVDEIASALVQARLNGIAIRVVSNLTIRPNSDDDRRIQLLKSIGCITGASSSVVLRGCLFASADFKSSFLFLQDRDGSVESGVLYSGRTDSAVVEQLALSFTEPTPTTDQISIALQQCNQNETDILIGLLRRVSQYEHRTVSITIEEVSVERLVCLTKYTFEHKYKQACTLIDLLQEHSARVFNPMCCVAGKERPVFFIPPIIERDAASGSQYVLDGVARVLACKHRDFTSITCIVITGVREPLPSSGRCAPRHVQVVSAPLAPDEQYEGFDRERIRLLPLAIECRNRYSVL